MILLYLLITPPTLFILLIVLEILQHNKIINSKLIGKLDDDIASSTFHKIIWIISCIGMILCFIALALIIMTFSTFQH